MAARRRPLSNRAQGKVAVLEEARRKWDHVHALVEQIYAQRSMPITRKKGGVASLKDPLGNLMKRVTRASADVAQLLSDHGFATLAEDVNQLVALGRLMGAVRKATVVRMRELVALVYEGFELAERKVREDDADEELLRRAY